MSPGPPQFEETANPQNPEDENQDLIKGLRMSVSKKKPMKRSKIET